MKCGLVAMGLVLHHLSFVLLCCWGVVTILNFFISFSFIVYQQLLFLSGETTIGLPLFLFVLSLASQPCFYRFCNLEVIFLCRFILEPEIEKKQKTLVFPPSIH